MLGTIVNAAAILVGGGIGLLLKGGMKEKYQNTIMIALALSVIYVGASGAISGLLDPEAESLLFIISLVLGAVVGEWLDIEARLAALGDWIEAKCSGVAKKPEGTSTSPEGATNLTEGTSTTPEGTSTSPAAPQNTPNSPESTEKVSPKGGNISIGFVTASLIFCVGSMAILGSIDSGIRADHTTLYIKSMLDGTMSIVLASTLGVGVLFSAASVFLYQGSITLFAQVLQPFITADMLRELGIVGGVLISCIGINMLKLKEIKVGNMLPAILVPIVYYLPFVQALLHWAN